MAEDQATRILVSRRIRCSSKRFSAAAIGEQNSHAVSCKSDGSVQVRNPSERLGIGIPDTDNDMHALRAHPFFAGLDWETLWTDPHPLIEPGMVKRQHPLARGHDQDWDDIGTAWDDLVGSELSDDEVEWAPEGDAPGYEIRRQESASPPGNMTTDLGPLGEIRRQDVLPIPHAVKEHKAAGRGGRDSPLTGSPTSSEDSPMENIALRMGDLALPPTDGSSPERSRSTEQSEQRGRNQATSPVQGNGQLNDVD